MQVAVALVEFEFGVMLSLPHLNLMSLAQSRSLDREPNIVLCQRRSSGLRTRHIVQLRDL